ncbi:MAG: ATP synthase F0 subunit C [Bacilli bacterium]|nr:ATP synthase F0 subunit C [Bacilli bacterium]
MKKHRLLTLSAALLASASLIGCNQKMVTVTFDAGIGMFSDGSRTKTMKVKAHTKISDLNLPTPSYEGYTTNSWVDSNSGESNDIVGEISSNPFLILYADYGINLEGMKAASIGKVANLLAEAIARQPESEKELRRVFLEMQFYFDAFTDGIDALSLAKAGSGAMESIARMPEETESIENLIFYTGEVILNCQKKDGRNIGMGKIASSTCETIARQPESKGDILKATAVAFEGIYNSPDPLSAAEGIGTASVGTLEAIARQPESANVLINDLELAIYYINHAK